MRRVSPHFSAPPVQYPVGRGAVLLWGLLALLGVGGLVLLLWVVQGAGDSVASLFVAGVIWLGAAASAGLFWRRRVQGVLQWDGVRWRLEAVQFGKPMRPVEGALWVRLDLQSQLWVCLDGADDAPAWLWLERQGAPERWGDLRRAVYSRAGPEAALAGESAAARRPQA